MHQAEIDNLMFQSLETEGKLTALYAANETAQNDLRAISGMIQTQLKINEAFEIKLNTVLEAIKQDTIIALVDKEESHRRQYTGVTHEIKMLKSDAKKNLWFQVLVCIALAGLTLMQFFR